MRKTLTIAAAVLGGTAIFAAPASAAPAELKPHQLAKQECKAEKRADKQAFRAVYGKRAMRTCVKGEKQEVREEMRNAAKDCKAERTEMGVEAFRDEYGNNKTGRNAFGKCVSSKVRAEERQEVREFRNAARTCRAEREELGAEEFRAQWGSEKSQGRNAFGKCVSATAQESEEESEA